MGWSPSQGDLGVFSAPFPFFLPPIAQPSLSVDNPAGDWAVLTQAHIACDPKVAYALWSQPVAVTGKRWLQQSHSPVPRMLFGISLNCQWILHLFLPLSQQLRDLRVTGCLPWNNFQGQQSTSLYLKSSKTHAWMVRENKIILLYRDSFPSNPWIGRFT